MKSMQNNNVLLNDSVLISNADVKLTNYRIEVLDYFCFYQHKIREIGMT